MDNSKKVIFLETEKNSKEFNMATNDEPIGEGYNELTAEPAFNQTLADCIYTLVCPDNKGAICGNEDGKKWDVNPCQSSSISLMKGCEWEKGKALNVENLMHRKYLFMSAYK